MLQSCSIPFFLNCCSRRCPNVHDANIPMAWGTAKSGAAASMHSEWMGFLGKNYRTPPYFMGKSMVSGEDFPNKTSPLSYNSLRMTLRTITILLNQLLNQFTENYYDLASDLNQSTFQFLMPCHTATINW